MKSLPLEERKIPIKSIELHLDWLRVETFDGRSYLPSGPDDDDFGGQFFVRTPYRRSHNGMSSPGDQ